MEDDLLEKRHYPLDFLTIQVSNSHKHLFVKADEQSLGHRWQDSTAKLSVELHILAELCSPGESNPNIEEAINPLIGVIARGNVVESQVNLARGALIDQRLLSATKIVPSEDC